jgi:hypothetical protein
MPCRETCSEKYVLLNAEVKPVYSNFTPKYVERVEFYT